MGEFVKDRLPDTIEYFDLEDVPLKGPGRWKTGPFIASKAWKVAITAPRDEQRQPMKSKNTRPHANAHDTNPPRNSDNASPP